MSFDLHKVKPHKKKIILVVGIVVIVAILGVVIYEVFKNTASADTGTATYIYTGVLKTGTGHQAPNKLVPNANITVGFAGATCTSRAVASVNIATKTDSNGAFTLSNLSKGCYYGIIDGSVRDSQGHTITVGRNFSLTVTAVTRPTAKNMTNIENQMYRINGTLSPTTAVVLPSPSPVPSPSVTASATSTPDLYTFTGALTDNSGNPLANATITNIDPQYSKIINGPGGAANKICDTNSRATLTSASVVTRGDGTFIMDNLPIGCFTMRISLSSGPTFSTGSRAIDSDNSKQGVIQALPIVIEFMNSDEGQRVTKEVTDSADHVLGQLTGIFAHKPKVPPHVDASGTFKGTLVEANKDGVVIGNGKAVGYTIVVSNNKQAIVNQPTQPGYINPTSDTGSFQVGGGVGDNSIVITPPANNPNNCPTMKVTKVNIPTSMSTIDLGELKLLCAGNTNVSVKGVVKKYDQNNQLIGNASDGDVKAGVSSSGNVSFPGGTFAINSSDGAYSIPFPVGAKSFMFHAENVSGCSNSSPDESVVVSASDAGKTITKDIIVKCAVTQMGEITGQVTGAGNVNLDTLHLLLYYKGKPQADFPLSNGGQGLYAFPVSTAGPYTLYINPTTIPNCAPKYSPSSAINFTSGASTVNIDLHCPSGVGH